MNTQKKVHDFTKKRRPYRQFPINCMHFAMQMVGYDRLYAIAENTNKKRQEERAQRAKEITHKMDQVHHEIQNRHDNALCLI